MTKTVKENQLLESIEGAKEKIALIYDDLDVLSGHLSEISEAVNRNTEDSTTELFHELWMMFPTYHTLDTLNDVLNELKERVESEEE